jgi:tRNA(Ile2) C34 agmatinyltransferase TiaS
MSNDLNPQEQAERIAAMDVESVVTLLANDLCPLCIGSLDTGYECNRCGYDAMPLVQVYGEERLKAAKEVKADV